MIDFEKALELILRNSRPIGIKTVSLNNALGYVLAEDIVVRESIPLFDSSAVDGYAVRFDDVASENSRKLKLQGVIRAGDNPTTPLKKMYAYKILTGAVVPNGADAVVMKEVAEERNGFVYIKSTFKKGENIRNVGEEFKNGDIALKTGLKVTPPVIGLLATLGYSKVKVYKQPRVSVIVTGDELRPPSARLRKGQIRDSNSFSLSAALQEMSIHAVNIHRVKDSPLVIKKILKDTYRRSDVVITVGGVSVGEYDYVRAVNRELGVNEIFWKIAIKPGKPVSFGVKNKTLFFGLPGNPVSALVTFYKLVRPAIYTLMGCRDIESIKLHARLTADLKKKIGRAEFVRGVLSTDELGNPVVSPTRGQDSHLMSGLASANCFIFFPKEMDILKKGSAVEVELIEW